MFDIGPIKPVGMGGFEAISEQDIYCWQFNRGQRLTPDECDLIRSASRAYAQSKSEADKPNCPPPWVAVVEEIDREKVAQSFAAWAKKMKKT